MKYIKKNNKDTEVIGGFFMFIFIIIFIFYCVNEFSNLKDVRKDNSKIQSLEEEKQMLERKLEIKKLEQENKQLRILLEEG